MKVAVAGCLHGELDRLYSEIDKQGKDVDLVLVCGDFQAIRNENDFHCIHVPPKYQQLGTFNQYYFGLKKAPILTIIIGGNHEASNYFQTLPYGGWIAPNMYYLGYASVINYGGLRIGGISGIFGKYMQPHHRHDNLGHFESLPYDRNSMVSAYHMRETEVYKLIQLRRNPEGEFRPILDILLSHDWPLNIPDWGNKGYLINKKPHFRDEINRGQFGNPLLLPLLAHLKPTNWFAGHMHVGFNANVDHYHACNVTPKPDDKPSKTEFQALHKFGFYFMQIREFKVENEPEVKKLEYDAEWLAVLKKTSHLFRVTRQVISSEHDFNMQPNHVEITDEEIAVVKEAFGNDMTITESFKPCDPVPEQGVDLDPRREQNFLNPQTTEFCQKLKIPDPNQMIIDLKNQRNLPLNVVDAVPVQNLAPDQPSNDDKEAVKNPDEINLDDSDDDCCGDKDDKDDKNDEDDDQEGSQSKRHKPNGDPQVYEVYEDV